MRGARGMAASLSWARAFCTNHLVLHHLGLVPRRLHLSPLLHATPAPRVRAPPCCRPALYHHTRASRVRVVGWEGLRLQPLRAGGSCGCSASISLQVISPSSLHIAGKKELSARSIETESGTKICEVGP
jgi:hypothetical protein